MINKLQILSLGIDSTYIWKWANSMLCFGDFINPVLMKIVTSNINNPLWGGLIRINPLHEWRVTTRSVTIRSCKSWKKGGGKRGKRGEKGGKGESTICHLCDITLFYIQSLWHNIFTATCRTYIHIMYQ